MEFHPSARFEGAQPGYVFKAGAYGLGYYRDAASAPARAPRKPAYGDNFLEHLEQVEAHDEPVATATGARPPPMQQQHYMRQQQAVPPQQKPPPSKPEWARVEAEGLTEARIAYGAHNGFAPADRRQRMEHRQLNTRSQIDFGSGYGGGNYHQQQVFDRRRGGGGAMPWPTQQMDAVRPAGGRSNLAGPSNDYGVRRFVTGHGVLA